MVVANLTRIERTLQELQYDYEIIAVVDGMMDKTYQNAKKITSRKIQVVGYKQNHGKGYALRYGMARSKGEIVAFIDGGSDLNPTGLQMLLAHFEWYKADIVVGSKWHPVSIVKYPLWRKIISLGYGTLVKMLFGLRIKDTQLGMKFFRREVLNDVLPRLVVKKWAFDIEILAVARRLGYTKIYEAPVELNWSEVESNLSKSIFTAIWETFVDTIAIFYRLRILRYYDDENKHKWVYDPDLNYRVNVG